MVMVPVVFGDDYSIQDVATAIDAALIEANIDTAGDVGVRPAKITASEE